MMLGTTNIKKSSRSNVHRNTWTGQFLVLMCVRKLSPQRQLICYEVHQYRRGDNVTVFLIWHSEDRASWYILITKPKKSTNFSNLFWSRTLHVSDSSSVHHEESSTVNTAIGICHTGYARGILIPLASSQHNLYDIYLLLCVQC